MDDSVYLGNPNLKKANTPIEFTEEQIVEFLKCKEDPVYFARKHIKIVSIDEEKKYVENTRKKMKERLQKDGMSESDASFLTSGVSNMDEHNLKMADVIAEEGMDEAAKQMFVHPTEGRKMSYSEMRSFYG